MLSHLKKHLFFLLLLALPVINTVAQRAPRYTISGFVRDSLTTENLIGATVYNNSNLAGATTNQSGFYSLTLPAGEVELVYSYVGYNIQTISFFLRRDTMININLIAGQHLQEVEITASRTSRIQESTQMSMISLPVTQIRAVPAALGEVDVMRVLQLMPGIQAGSEGSTGLHVRGGSPDQNLILLDEAPVYNASHLLGFMSLFNGDAINNIEVYKGGFPARYGGRVSSVLDISMKDGNLQKFHGEGSIGILWSKLTLEGPVAKNKTSFIVTGRRTYMDLLMLPFINATNNQGNSQGTISKGGYYFYDLTAKINHKFSDKDRIYLSVYKGNDNLFVTMDNKYEHEATGLIISGSDRLHTGMQWGNFMTAFRWNHIFTNRLFSNTTLSYSRYRDDFLTKTSSKRTYDVNAPVPQTVTEEDFSEIENNSGIQDYMFKISFDYFPSPQHRVRFGGSVIYHTFIPGRVSLRDMTGNREYGASTLHNYEYSAYAEDDILLTERLKTNIGLHWSAFATGDRLYSVFQPRISARYLLTVNLSAKASYSRMAQYIHLLPNSFGGFPKDFWVPTTALLKPQTADQISFGLAHNYREKYELSLEGYYKKLTNPPDYKYGGAGSLINFDGAWEQNLLQGTGRSYGTELFAQKKTGAFTGWAGYTLSWSDRQFDELNGGKSFPYKYDRRHDFSIALLQRFERNTRRKNKTKIIEMSGAWVFSSGHCITLPVGRVDYVHPIFRETSISGLTRQYIEYGERNGYRMKPYHRLDLSISFVKQKKWGERRWIWSVYNAYNRKNPYTVGLRYQDENYRLTQYSLFPILPSVNYQFKF